MRVVLWSCAALMALSPNAAFVQPTAPALDSERSEEIVVRGKRLNEIRVEVQRTRELAYAIFNEINSTNDFDVLCDDERKYHSRATKRVCRPRFESRISAQTAKEYIATLNWTCQPEPGSTAINTQACMFSAPGVNATARAQAVGGQAAPLRDRMNDEILRLANEDERFGQAILDFYEADRRYKAARGGRADDED